MQGTVFILHSGISPLSGSVMSWLTCGQALSVASQTHSHTYTHIHTASYKPVGKINEQNVGHTHIQSKHIQTHA